VIVKAYLVVNTDGEVRACRKPRLRSNEVAFPVSIYMPDGWGKIVGPEVKITVPDTPSLGAARRV
jgi:hypothetical protein